MMGVSRNLLRVTRALALIKCDGMKMRTLNVLVIAERAPWMFCSPSLVWFASGTFQRVTGT